MKLIGAFSTAVLLLFLGIPAHARTQQQDQDRQRTNSTEHTQSNHDRGQESKPRQPATTRTETRHQGQMGATGQVHEQHPVSHHEGQPSTGQVNKTQPEGNHHEYHQPSSQANTPNPQGAYRGQQPQSGHVYSRPPETGNRERQGQHGQVYQGHEEGNRGHYGNRDRDEHEREGERFRDNLHFRIPRDRWRAHFGREHRFRIYHPVIFEGYPRFDYDDYWFRPVNPWPSDWSYDDECYIDEVGDEYYLYDLAHPGVRIMLMMLQPY